MREEQTYMVTQNGTTLQLKDDKGSEIAKTKMTSDTTLSAGPILNSNGLVLPDRSIQWSNGTLWHKQIIPAFKMIDRHCERRSWRREAIQKSAPWTLDCSSAPSGASQ